MKMRQVPLMFHRAFRDYTKRIGFSEFGGTIAYPLWSRLTIRSAPVPAILSCGAIFPAMDATNPCDLEGPDSSDVAPDRPLALTTKSCMGSRSAELRTAPI